LKFSLAGKEVWLTLLPKIIASDSFSLWSLKVQGQSFRIYLSRFPDLSDLDPKFQEVNWRLLSPKLRLLFWEAVLSPLLELLESFLNGKVSLVSVEEYCHEVDFSEAVGFHAFLPTDQRSFVGYLQAEYPIFESLQNLWRHQDVLPLRIYDDLYVDYTLELGHTELTKECYEKIQEEDLILFDHYSLAPNSVTRLRGLEPIQVSVVSCEEGFRVQKVQF
jgi:hypothetical protein